MTYPKSTTYPTPADKLFTTLIAILLLCAASFYAGRVTAPVRTSIRYRPAPAGASGPAIISPGASALTPNLPCGGVTQPRPAGRER